MIYAIFNHNKQMKILILAGQKVRSLPGIGFFLSRMFEYLVRIIFASDISCAAKIPSDVKFIHGHDIVIGANVTIGLRCKIFNGVTLGNRDTEGGHDDQPIVGNDCILSTGAKILGKIRIGDRSIVAANAVVLKDVPPDSVAIGVPARVIARKNGPK